MMLRLLALSLLGSLTACTLLLDLSEEEGRPCSEGRCLPGYLCEQGLCVKESVCEPACPDWAACVAHRCEPRYDGVWVTTPTSLSVVDGGPLPISAQLKPRPGRTPWQAPTELTYSIRGLSGSTSTGPLASLPDGGYSGTWTPTAEGVHEVKVSYPEAGLVSAPVVFNVDLSAPTFVIALPPPSREGSGAPFRDWDPRLPEAWPRDERLQLTIRAQAVDVEPGSVSLTVVGSADGGMPGQAEPPLPVTPLTPCDAGYCGTATVDLWKPPLPGFRGTFTLRLQGADKVGNLGTTTVSLPVTRWKWDYDTGASIKASPAIGHEGTLYVGTHNGASGSLLAFSPEGTVRWQRATAPIHSSPAVGQASGGRETVYYASSGASGQLVAVEGTDGGVLAQSCVTGDFQGALAVGPTTGAADTVETAIGVMNSASANSSQLVALRPSSSAAPCVTRTGLDNVSAAGGVVMKGAHLHYPDTKGRIQGFTFGASGLSPKAGWPVTLGQVAHALAFSGSQVVGGSELFGEGSLFALDETSGVETWRPRLTTGPWMPAITSLHQVLVGAADNTLLAATLGASGAPGFVATDGVVRGAPVLGEDGRVYAADTAGVLHVLRAEGLVPEWKLSDTLMGPVEASPTLDCARDAQGRPLPGRPGVLYVAASDGRLFAFVVDSRGLDTTADWPRYQHDPRNTGNPTTPLSAFACP